MKVRRHRPPAQGQLLPRHRRDGGRRAPGRRPRGDLPRPLRGGLRPDPAAGEIPKDADARPGRPAALRRGGRRPTATWSCIPTGGASRRRSSRAGSTASSARASSTSSATEGGDRPPEGQDGRGVHHLEHAPRRGTRAVRRPAGEPLEDLRLRLLRRRGLLPPQLRVDHPQHAEDHARVARRGPSDRRGDSRPVEERLRPPENCPGRFSAGQCRADDWASCGGGPPFCSHSCPSQGDDPAWPLHSSARP